MLQDKTFGLKNKKGAKTQKFIQQVEKQVKSGGLHPVAPKATKKDEKEQKLKEAKEMAVLFRPVQAQKVELGTDPKSVVCAFFKQGNCGKGDKCKFSHDLSVERKTEKRSIYVDMRDVDLDGATMETWTESKLQEVVNKKHATEKAMPTTTIVFNHYINSIVVYTYYLCLFRFANFFWMPLKSLYMVGSGNALMVKNVYIVMLYHLVLSSKKIKRKLIINLRFHWKI